MSSDACAAGSLLGTSTTWIALIWAIDRTSGAVIGVELAPRQLLVVLVAGIVLGYLAALIPATRSTGPEVLDAGQVT